MQFDIITLFPGLFSSYLQESLLGKAIQNGLLEVRLHDLRRWSTDRHQRVDDRPFGGGPGMVLMVEPVVRCVEELRAAGDGNDELVLLTPQGERLCQPMVESLATARRLILLCGRYEGFDQRVIDLLQPREISIGDFVLNGGEVAAMVVIDAVIRLVPGVLGDEQSAVDDSFSTGNRGLEYPHFTRPREFRGLAVPDVLLEGNHRAIEEWRRDQAAEKTRRRRASQPPDS
jgi:tRNA (guanine37-N1)-methyltransferase